MAIIDARDLPEATSIEADLIIIGGGMAGIAIATEWAGANKTVAILESGGLDFDQTIQDLYRGAGVMRGPGNADKNMDDYTWQSRFRVLGGSGGIWGGKCVPLDEADFTRRDWLTNTGWPITRAQLQPFYDRACDILEIPHFDKSFDRPQEGGRPPLVINGARDFFSAARYFSPIGGGADLDKFNRFRTGFAEAANVNIYTNANVTAINKHRRRRRIDNLSIACLNGKRHTARARSFILATGGIENVRLLLASNLGNDSDWLGRNFMGHVTYGAFNENAPMTMLALSDAAQPVSLYTDNDRDKVHCVVAASLEGQRRLNIGNFTATLVNADPSTLAYMPAIFKLTGAVDRGGPPAREAEVYFMSEHLPNRESRITLDATETDALGLPKVRLEWVYSERDFDNLEAGVAGLAAALGEAGLGRLCWPVARSDYLAILSTSRHHMGTTRMSVEAEHGVVDEHCKLHGIDNLYVAGSSVFPTSGIANPTLTIIALAMRMSDHLKRELGVRS